MSKYFLLIDDDEDDRLLFCLAAAEAENSITCVTAQNQQEAFQALAEGQPLPDLIFLDLNMPVMSGWEFLQEFKRDARLREVPVIIYSTSSSQRDIDRARDLWAQCFLVKPDDFTQLKGFLDLLSSGPANELRKDLKNAAFRNCHYLEAR